MNTIAKSIELTDEQFKNVLNSISIEEAKKAVVILRKRIDQQTINNLNMPIDELGLNKRTTAALKKINVNDLQQLLEYDIEDLLRLKSVGIEAIKDVEANVFKVYRKK